MENVCREHVCRGLAYVVDPAGLVGCLLVRLLTSFPQPCLPRTALGARVSRSVTSRVGLLSFLLALLAAAPDALVLADASPAAILASSTSPGLKLKSEDSPPSTLNIYQTARQTGRARVKPCLCEPPKMRWSARTWPRSAFRTPALLTALELSACPFCQSPRTLQDLAESSPAHCESFSVNSTARCASPWCRICMG